ncbi:hypothetical protein HCH_00652 [Hahella chejuensis KCTC 2396]|uniref:Uncharacterized protein n=1 Tax=Hahella chejuensis (strain KCTC 2396) TaxID=349521 RepID=Q2SP71_HAHCH|nr:hypothetical protein HCH_00652 [Hahella chejuensis KCTC 2396]
MPAGPAVPIPADGCGSEPEPDAFAGVITVTLQCQ